MTTSSPAHSAADSLLIGAIARLATSANNTRSTSVVNRRRPRTSRSDRSISNRFHNPSSSHAAPIGRESMTSHRGRAPGPRRSTPTTARSARPTNTLSASSPEPGCASSGAAGRTTRPTTPPCTASPTTGVCRWLLDTGLLTEPAGVCAPFTPLGRPPAAAVLGRSTTALGDRTAAGPFTVRRPRLEADM
jgi:hypothetical protein